MTFSGQWKTDTGFKLNVEPVDSHRSIGYVTYSPPLSEGVLPIHIPNKVVYFDADGFPVDYPHVGKLMTKRRGEEKEW